MCFARRRGGQGPHGRFGQLGSRVVEPTPQHLQGFGLLRSEPCLLEKARDLARCHARGVRREPAVERDHRQRSTRLACEAARLLEEGLEQRAPEGGRKARFELEGLVRVVARQAHEPLAQAAFARALCEMSREELQQGAVAASHPGQQLGDLDVRSRIRSLEQPAQDGRLLGQGALALPQRLQGRRTHGCAARARHVEQTVGHGGFVGLSRRQQLDGLQRHGIRCVDGEMRSDVEHPLASGPERAQRGECLRGHVVAQHLLAAQQRQDPLGRRRR